MNQLPDEIIFKILDELHDLNILVQLSKSIPNRFTFSCLFRRVVVRDDHFKGRDEIDYILKQGHDTLFRFSIISKDYVRITPSELRDKLELLNMIKPYISDIEFNLDIEDQEIIHRRNDVEKLFSDTCSKNLECDTRMYSKKKFGGFKNSILYDLDLITSYGTTSITSLILESKSRKRLRTLELSGQVFPSLKRLDVRRIWIKVLDFDCPINELRLRDVGPPCYPSIHELRQLKYLSIEVNPYSRDSFDSFDERLSVEAPKILADETLESLEILKMSGVKCSSLSLHCFPNLKEFYFYNDENNIVNSSVFVEGFPATLEDLWFENIKGLVKVPSLKETNIRSVSIDYSEIENLGNLFSERLDIRSVDLSENKLKEIPDIVEHPNVTNLKLDANELSHIGTFLLPKLKSLDLRSNPLDEIVSLKGCQSLQTLRVGRCNLKDIKFIKDLTELEEFDAEHNEISSVQPLAGKTKLKQLDLRFNKLKDISSLNSCLGLRVLRVTGNRIENVDLIGLEHLNQVGISNNMLHDLEDIALSEGVDELEMKGNCIIVLKGNTNLRNVKDLTVSRNQIKKIENMNELQSLERLDLSSNSISNFIGFDGLKGLKSLDLYRCPIDSLKGINSISNLETVGFSFSKFLVLDGGHLRGMSFLSDLTIAYSSLRQLKNITMLPIEKLDLSNNKIEVLNGIEHLPKLEKLDVSFNKIKSIEDSFGDFPSLRALYLTSNYLTTASGLEKIKSRKILKVSCDHLDTSSTELMQSNIKFV